MDIRAVIRQAMAGYYWHTQGEGPWKRGYRGKLKYETMTANKLSKLSGVPSRTVYDFIDGKGPINSDALGELLDVLAVRVLTPAEYRAARDDAAKVERVHQLQQSAKRAKENDVMRKALMLLARKNRSVFSEIERELCPTAAELPLPSVTAVLGRGASPTHLVERLLHAVNGELDQESVRQTARQKAGTRSRRGNKSKGSSKSD